MDRFAKYIAVSRGYRGQQCDGEAVTTLHLDDGTTQEISNLRRVICKRATRKRGSTVYHFESVDLAALDQVFPFETFTVADWPNVFAADVGKRVCQGVGSVRKVPLILIDTDGSTFWKYAGPKIIGTAGTLQTVYRGLQAAHGAIVDAGEYTTGTATAPSGYQVATVIFGREQIAFSGQNYLLEADYSLPGSRLPADELARILALFGVTTDSTTFSAAASYDNTAGFAVDALYGGAGRTGRAIVADLCDSARAWPASTSGGGLALTQDSPRTSVAQYNMSCDLAEIDEYGDADVAAKVTLFYRPASSLAEDWANTLSRTTSGASAEMQRHNPYISDHGVADRYLSYWQKRLNYSIGPSGGIAKGTIHAVQHASGDRITVTDAATFVGTKDFILPNVTRAADANGVTLREYNADTYVYTAGTLPSNATNGYSPDYTYTPPAAPTSLTAVSGGTSTAADGAVRAYESVSCTVPAVNWQKVTFQATDTTTNEIYQVQATVSGTTASAIIGNMPPARAMQVRVWATNSNNVDGATAGPVSFTTATSSAAPSAPATATVGQTQSLQMDYSWGAVTAAAGAAPIATYLVQESVNGGTFATVASVAWPNTSYSRTSAITGFTYQIKVQAIDKVGNTSTAATSGAVTCAKKVDDTYIPGGGVSGASIANSSINQGRQTTSTTSQSGTILGSNSVSVGGGSAADYSYMPNLTAGGSGQKVSTLFLPLGPASGTQWLLYIQNNDPASVSYDTKWKQVTP